MIIEKIITKMALWYQWIVLHIDFDFLSGSSSSVPPTSTPPTTPNIPTSSLPPITNPTTTFASSASSASIATTEAVFIQRAQISVGCRIRVRVGHGHCQEDTNNKKREQGSHCDWKRLRKQKLFLNCLETRFDTQICIRFLHKKAYLDTLAGKPTIYWEWISK